MNLAGAIIGHMVGDYLLQNDWMAEGKKLSHYICLLHASIWTWCVGLMGGIPVHLWFILLFTHFAQDRWGFIGWYMRKFRQVKFSQSPMAPWSIIVVDNAFHLLTIYLVSFL